jgi:cytochrome c oxidase subunit 2
MSSEKSMEKDTNHLSRILWMTLILSVAADLLFWFLVGPHVPPGRMTSSATDDQLDFNILMVIALPVLIGVWVYFGYAFVHWGSKKGTAPEPVGGPAARSNNKVSFLWIAITTVVVLFLAGFGTVELIVGNGSGGGEGPNPVWEPTGAAKAETAALTSSDSWTPGAHHVLVVQVIGQQWKFTYRYPQFGGFESQELILPNDTTIAFNVTSLDVIHSFWAYQLEVKADANPQENNVAFTTTKQTGSVTVRCSELCGLWHGAMYNYGKVVSVSDFQNWATTTESANAANTKDLPAFAWTYVPDANGASGGFYPDGNVTPYSTVETYGAKQPAS